MQPPNYEEETTNEWKAPKTLTSIWTLIIIMILLLGYFGYLNHKARQHQQQEIEQYIKQGCTVTPQGIDYLVECKQQTLLLDESLQNLIGISKGNES